MNRRNGNEISEVRVVDGSVSGAFAGEEPWLFVSCSCLSSFIGRFAWRIIRWLDGCVCIVIKIVVYCKIGDGGNGRAW